MHMWVDAMNLEICQCCGENNECFSMKISSRRDDDMRQYRLDMSSDLVKGLS